MYSNLLFRYILLLMVFGERTLFSHSVLRYFMLNTHQKKSSHSTGIFVSPKSIQCVLFSLALKKILWIVINRHGLPRRFSGKKKKKKKSPPANAGDMGSIPGSERSPREGNCNPLQDSCLGNLMDRGAWKATVHGITKSETWLSNWALLLLFSRQVGSNSSTHINRHRCPAENLCILSTYCAAGNCGGLPAPWRVPAGY